MDFRALTVLLATASLLAACGSDREGPRDVLLITVDTLRADMVGIHGHPRPSTPNIDAIGAEGLVLERHYATAPMTAPSHASMFTGLWVAEHGLVRNGRTFPADVPTLAEELADAGYRTAAVIGSMVLDRKFGIDRGFEIWNQEIELADGKRRNRVVAAERYASEVVDDALEILEGSPEDEPLFLWVHVFDPHAPFEAPSRHIEARGAAKHFRGRVEPSPFHSAPALVAHYVGYEQEIAYTDHELGRLLDAWERRAGGPRSVVAITSDHGEGMGEHGFIDHGLYLYEEQLHVPFVLRARGRVPSGSRIGSPTSMVDLAHTLSTLAEYGDPTAFPGHDLSGLLDGGASRPVRAERPLYSDFDLKNPVRAQPLSLYADRGRARGAQVALIDGNWKTILSEDDEPEVYDLATDPREHVNLRDAASERLDAFRREFEAWGSALRSASTTEDLEDEATLEMLEALGYR